MSRNKCQCIICLQKWAQYNSIIKGKAIQFYFLKPIKRKSNQVILLSKNHEQILSVFVTKFTIQIFNWRIAELNESTRGLPNPCFSREFQLTRKYLPTTWFYLCWHIKIKYLESVQFTGLYEYNYNTKILIFCLEINRKFIFYY